MKIIDFLKSRWNKKIALSAIAAAFLLFLGSTNFTHASILGDISYTIFSKAAEIIAYILAWIMGVFISIEAWLISVVLNINANVFNTSFVQTGFSISLSVANLAFVLGIIVIALATILRIENYSIKKMLWKLVIMAILVNFGLVIIAPIFGFANATTQYFLSSFPGGGGFDNFATTMTAKFNPGAVLKFDPSVSGGNSGALGSTSGPMSTSDSNIGVIGGMMVPIFSLVFTVVDLLLIVFVLGAFIVMLTIRYVYIAILAILLPFAWASWVFPSFSSMYSKWWSKFLQWTFFAPIFMFFLYLALATMGGSNNADAFAVGGYTQGNVLFSAITDFFGSIITPIITNFLQDFVLAGLIFGGMIAAESMGVKFAGTAIKGAQNVGKAAQGYVGKQSKKAGRAAFRKAGGERALNAMREGRLGGLEGVPGLKWAASRAASTAATAITPHVNNSDLVDAEKKKVSKDPNLVKSELKGNLNTEKVFARLASLIESGELDEDTMVGNQKAGAWMDAHEQDAANYGFTKSAKDADKVLGSNKAMRTASAGLTTKDLEDPNNLQAQELRNATAEFVRGLKGEDIAKLNVNKMFDPKNGNNPIQAELARAFATDGPGDAAKAIGKMSGATKANFAKVYKVQIEDAQDTPGLNQLKQADAELEELKESRKNNPEEQQLRADIAKLLASPRFDKENAELKQKNEQLAQITTGLDKKIEDANKKRSSLEENLTFQDKNIQSALKYFKASLVANATFGGPDPTVTAAAAPAPAPAPQNP